MIVGHIIFEPLEMCIFRGKCPKTEIPPFEITFPAPKPPVTPPTPPSNTTTKAYVLHFTDIHYVTFLYFCFFEKKKKKKSF